MSQNPKDALKAKLRKNAPALIIAGGVLIIALLIVALPSRSEDKEAEPPPPAPVTVIVIRPSLNVEDMFERLGKVEPNRVVDVAGEVDGRVMWVNDHEGHPIAKGAELVRLNTDLIQAAHDRAKAIRDFEEKEQNRVKVAKRDGAATDREVAEAKAKAETSQADYDAAKARLERTTIVAPIPGTLESVLCEEGAFCTLGTVVARIVEMDPAKVIVHVPQRDIASLKLKDKARIGRKGVNGEPVKLVGDITFIGELADPSTNTTRIEIEVKNTPRVLRSGDIVRVQLIRAVLAEAIIIPLDTIIPLEKSKAVYVVGDDGKAQRKTVTYRLHRRDTVIVLSGLKAGDRLIDNPRSVSPGQPVNVLSETESTSQPASPAAQGAPNES